MDGHVRGGGVTLTARPQEASGEPSCRGEFAPFGGWGRSVEVSGARQASQGELTETGGGERPSCTTADVNSFDHT